MGMPEGRALEPEGNRKDAAWWTFALVEERLIEASTFLDRVSKGGRSPFAGDAPWHLMVRHNDVGAQTLDDMADASMTDGSMTDAEREHRVRGGLRAAEVDRMEQALEWVTLVQDRRGRLRPLIGAVLQQKQRGGQVDWAVVKRRLRSSDSHACLRMSYSRGVTAITIELNRKGVPVTD